MVQIVKYARKGAETGHIHGGDMAGRGGPRGVHGGWVVGIPGWVGACTPAPLRPCPADAHPWGTPRSGASKGELAVHGCRCTPS